MKMSLALIYIMPVHSWRDGHPGGKMQEAYLRHVLNPTGVLTSPRCDTRTDAASDPFVYQRTILSILPRSIDCLHVQVTINLAY